MVGTDVDPVAARSSGGEATFEVCRRARTDNGAFPYLPFKLLNLQPLLFCSGLPSLIR